MAFGLTIAPVADAQAGAAEDQGSAASVVPTEVSGADDNTNPSAVPACDAQSDRAALVALYDATDGPNWKQNTNWKTDKPLAEWYGVTTDSTGRVTRLDLSLNNLSGPLPAAICNLTGLITLYLYSNSLNGWVPSEIGNLTNLTILSLGGNDFSGSIPAAIGNLTQLTHLGFPFSGLSGPIPSEMKALTNLQHLNLRSNGLWGEIPDLSSLSQLEVLFLEGNSLTGPIPAWLGDLGNLTKVYLRKNYLSGTIPVKIGNLSELVMFDAGANQLSGSIPVKFGDLANLMWLYFDSNDLSGSIPVKLGDLSDLRLLALQRNDLSGSIPVELGDLSDLTYLAVGGNNLSGSVPTQFGNLGRLTQLGFSKNALSGPLPTEFKNLTSLIQLVLNGNGLCVPAALSQWSWYQTIINAGLTDCNDPATVPGAPAAPDVAAREGSLELRWSAPVSDDEINDYDVQYRKSSSQEWSAFAHDGPVTFATINGLENNHAYEVRVRAVSSSGSGAWSASATATPSVPSQPAVVENVILAAAPGQLRVSWDEPADNGAPIAGYDLRCRPGTADGWVDLLVGVAATSAAIIELRAGAPYDVQVRAVNSAGPGPWSSTVSAEPSNTADLADGCTGATTAERRSSARRRRPPAAAQPVLENYFTDIGHVQLRDEINKIAAADITVGCESQPPQFCPDQPVTRGQLALFLARTFRLIPSDSYPHDDPGFKDTPSFLASSAAAVAFASVVEPCDEQQHLFCPDLVVTRGQAAIALARVLKLTASDGEPAFIDTPDPATSDAATALAAAGVTLGCDEQGPRFCPQQDLKRHHLAAFLSRACQYRCEQLLGAGNDYCKLWWARARAG